MCKRILDVIQNLYKQLFGRKHCTTLSGDISEAIFHQICYVLPTLYDKSIFDVTSFEQLGKLYFNYVHTAVDCATDDNIKEIIRRMRTSDYEFAQQNDYWLALTDIVHIKTLPHDVYEKVKKEYNTVYRPKYQNAKKKYKAKLDLLTAEIYRLEEERKSIKENILNKRSVIYAWFVRSTIE